MRRWIIALSAVLVALIGVLVFMLTRDDEPSSSTTTSLAVATTSGSVTTTAPGETTTTAARSTTTSTPASTTTEATGLEGNWASQPLVAAPFGALGWWEGDGWAQVEEGSSLPISGGEDYQIALLGTEGVITGSGQELLCDPLNNPGVIFEDEEVLGDFPGPVGVAISADWELVPYLVEEISDDGSYAAVASSLLAAAGLDVPDPVMKQVIRFDLEGDGVNEVAVVAEDVTEGLFGETGDYSLAFVQKVIDDQPENILLGQSILTEATEGEAPIVVSFTIAAVADLNGDGEMEVVLDSAYYEGISVEVWQFMPSDVGGGSVISSSCGA